MLWKTLPDKDEHPEGAYGNGTITDDAMAVYMKHCYPNEEQILARVSELRREYLRPTAPGPGAAPRTLDVLYLLTNGDREWVRGLTEKLSAEWGTIITSKDVVLDDEQMDVGMAVDMEVGRRAAVFVGNAVSV
jgi:FMN phosphatase YigB (HAD superfamily)